MSTSDDGAAEQVADAGGLSIDLAALPDLALVTRIANELFAEFPGRVAAAQAAPVELPAAPPLPSAVAALPLPPAPAGVPFTPPTSNLSPGWSPVPDLAPTSAPSVSPAPVPAVPSIPPAPAPVGPTAGLPHLPSEDELRLLPSTLAAHARLVPADAGSASSQVVPPSAGGGVPVSPQSAVPIPEVPGMRSTTAPSTDLGTKATTPGVAGLPVDGAAAGSPVPMPDADSLGRVAPLLSGVMGSVADLPLDTSSEHIGHLDLASAAELHEHPFAAAPSNAPFPTSGTALSDTLPGAPVSLRTGAAEASDEAASAPGARDVVPASHSGAYRPDLVAVGATSARPFDPHAIRRDFPILDERVHGRRLIWLDNAATTQKPQAVIDRLTRFYEHENSNIHRAAHTIAARATDAYEGAREKVRRFLNAASTEEIVFVRGTTEAINLVASTWGTHNIGEGDEILVTHLEHHANIVPWQMLCARTGAVLKVAPVDDTGQVILSEYQRLVGPRTRLVSFTQVSNALGTVTPSKAMIDIAHRQGAVVLLDGAQSVSHLRADVQALDCDFFVFSGHKVFGPTGIGVVYGKASVLAGLPPYQGGGNMIADVTFERTVYQPPPARFEAGTGNIADAVGLGAALDYLTEVGIENVAAYEHQLLEYATEGLCTVPGLTLIGTAAEKTSVLSFVFDGFRTEDVGAALDREGIAVRSGHHCAQPILRRFGVEATVRPSLAMYTTTEDVDVLVAALHRLRGRGGAYPTA
jgi:cysteine desulfurase/selenocysteine lyase